MTTPISYIQSLIKPQVAELYFNRLWDELEWVRHDKVPRREYYVNRYPVPYTYGSPLHARTYQPQVNHDVIQAIAQAVSHYTEVTPGMAKFTPDVCFLNGYQDGKDQLGWHSDDSPEMDDHKAIAIVTLGEEREIWFRRTPFANGECSACNGSGRYDATGSPPCGACGGSGKGSPSAVTKLLLGNGSLCLMAPGMQDSHQHRIPKSGNSVCGPRISLTFRGYVVPKSTKVNKE